jgi:hypothetical protein
MEWRSAINPQLFGKWLPFWKRNRGTTATLLTLLRMLQTKAVPSSHSGIAASTMYPTV